MSWAVGAFLIFYSLGYPKGNQWVRKSSFFFFFQNGIQTTHTVDFVTLNILSFYLYYTYSQYSHFKEKLGQINTVMNLLSLLHSQMGPIVFRECGYIQLRSGFLLNSKGRVDRAFLVSHWEMDISTHTSTFMHSVAPTSRVSAADTSQRCFRPHILVMHRLWVHLHTLLSIALISPNKHRVVNASGRQGPIKDGNDMGSTKHTHK